MRAAKQSNGLIGADFLPSVIPVTLRLPSISTRVQEAAQRRPCSCVLLHVGRYFGPVTCGVGRHFPSEVGIRPATFEMTPVKAGGCNQAK